MEQRNTKIRDVEVGAAVFLDNPGTVAIAKTIKSNKIVVCAVILNGQLDLKAYDYFDTYRKANESEAKILNEKLAENRLSWDSKRKIFISLHDLREGSFIKFCKLHQEKEVCIGILKKVDSSGIFYVYSFRDQFNKIRCTYDEAIGNISEFCFCKATKNEQASLLNLLKESGFKWNRSYKRIEPVNLRCPKGQKYYYISDQFQILMEVERQSVLDEKRFRCGNYFKNKINAQKIIQKLIFFIKGNLCQNKS